MSLCEHSMSKRDSRDSEELDKSTFASSLPTFDPETAHVEECLANIQEGKLVFKDELITVYERELLASYGPPTEYVFIVVSGYYFPLQLVYTRLLAYTICSVY